MSELTAEQKGNIKFHLGMGEGPQALTSLMPGETAELKAEQAKAVSDCYTATLNADQCLDDLAAGRLGGAGLALTEDQRKGVADCLTLGLGVDRIAEVIANGSTDPAVQTRAKETAGQIYGRYLATGDVDASFGGVTGSASARLSSSIPASHGVSAPDEIRVTATPQEIAAFKICKDFFNELAKEMTMTGVREVDYKSVQKKWLAYKAKHHGEPGLEDAQDTIYRVFEINVVGWDAAGFTLAGIFVLDVILGYVIDLPSDDNVLTGDVFSLLVFGPMNVDLKAMNRDLDGPVNLNKFFFGLLGQIYYNPLLDGWLKTIDDPNKRLLAKDIFVATALVGMTSAIVGQNQVLDISWAERYQGSFRDMVQSLVNLLYINPGLGIVPQEHRWMPEVDPEAHWGYNTASFALRGALAIQLYLGARADARQHIQGEIQQKIIGQLDSEEHLDENFRVTSYVISENHSAKGFASGMNDALFMSDMIIQTAEDVMQLSHNDNRTVSKITPLAAFAVTTATFGLLISKDFHDNPAQAMDLNETGGSLEDFVEKYRLNQRPAGLEDAAQKAADETALAFLLGGLESLGAAYSTNRSDVVDAFMQVNRMIPRNFAHRYTALDATRDFAESGQETGDQYDSINRIMDSLSIVDIPVSAWAGFEAGSTAALSGKPYTPEYWPAYMGFALNIYYLSKAYEHAGEKEWAPVIEAQWTNFGVYTATASVSYAMSRLLGHPFDFKFEFDAGRYRVRGDLGPNGAGLIAGVSFDNNNGEEYNPAHESGRVQIFLAKKEQEWHEVSEKIAGLSPDDSQVTVLLDRQREIAEAMAIQQIESLRLEEETLNVQIGRLNAVLALGTIPFDSRDDQQIALLRHVLNAGDDIPDNMLVARCREKTGVDVMISGMNPVLKKYRASLEIQQRQLAVLSGMLAGVLPA
ncbi:MAG: hypothetical protein HY541_04900 [Deltaproteobacteria bacterium]|nr:hypothetical protein [Deltaproteobacteria bacterium]